MKRWTGVIVLFLSVTLLSLIWHFPASWVAQHSWVKQSLPKPMTMSEVDGLWWQGKAKISWQHRPVGTVEWQWHPVGLVTGSLVLNLKLSAPKAHLEAQVSADTTEVAVKNMNGTFSLSYLSNLFKSASILQAAEGDVVLKDVSSALAQASLSRGEAWPNHLKGQMVLVDFDLMGIHLPLLKVTPELNSEAMTLRLNGTGKGWQLTGTSLVTANHRFQNNLVLTSKTPQSFPSWGGVMMQKTAPNKAVLKNTGRW
ncbi:type II secretion system protein N [Hydrogenovibrio crunogenus]|uniref:Type II secretion system protein N n=1 Tax=Hydrogenovibrio crunogenus TaxID=39765 RepID=A0A4P7NXP0_9GAMM|nr:type II secretion system protein N [Hydrogenovibrio crunogenus]QBZ82245.1 type II secretion system protein N [Hydrogenovibrio crunogenus]